MLGHTKIKMKGSVWGLLILWFMCIGSTQAQTNSSSLIEVSGRVEVLPNATTNWLAAKAGLKLQPGDKVRTLTQSRAAVQLSDRSVIRLNESTTLEILPPRNAEKKRFGLIQGAIYFFNREKPADVEFDTPLAAGAIRGTEFLLQVSQDSSVQLALIDGLVSLKTDAEEVNLQRGQELMLSKGSPSQQSPLINVSSKIQWALYYPVIVALSELDLTPEDQSSLAEVLANYRAGDFQRALATWPQSVKETGVAVKILKAQLELGIGRVTEAEKLLNGSEANPTVEALKDLISFIRADGSEHSSKRNTASALLVHSYYLQSRGELKEARQAAQQAVHYAPDSGPVLARLAELDFSFGDHRAALLALDKAEQLAPKLSAALALRGFVLLERGDVINAWTAFEHARESDASLGTAWLGRGLCLLRQRQLTEARASFQTAAALEPQRSIFRSYLGKVASAIGDAKAAEKEFRLAKELDANDPTAWLYSALHLWQENKLNAAIRDLETSSEKNDNRAVFRSRQMLDSDRSVRSANLAAIYDDAGLTEVSQQAAARSANESYLNFSGHLFLANSYQSLQEANRFDLRYETARKSELLVANLLAPPGAGNLSQVLSESDHLRFFDQKPIGFSSLTSYSSRGDWSETATAFGSIKGLSYALDTVYQSSNGQRLNNESEQRDIVLTLKQRITTDDEAYLQIGSLRSKAGDIANLYDPTTATPALTVRESQEPDIYAGWHHTWSPGSQTMFLVSRLKDDFSLHDPQSDQIFLVQAAGATQSVQSPPLGPPFQNDFTSRTILYSTELQQVFEQEHHSLVFGGRWQTGEIDSSATLSRALTGVVSQQNGQSDFARSSLYGYYTWRPIVSLRLTGGITYDHLDFPENTDFAPLSLREISRDKISPKAGLVFTPWERGQLRASYTRSSGGLFFDNSVRLEPTQVGGFNQAFRSLIPESVAGLLPGAEFETANLGFDQSFNSGTFLGVEAGWLTSGGTRTVGVLTNSLFLPIPDSPSSTRQQLDFRERNLSAYAAQLLGDYFSASIRYRLSQANLKGTFPEVPVTATGLGQIEQNNRAVLHQLTLGLNFNHPTGLFSRWETAWFNQSNFGYTYGLPGDDFWQHNFTIGYRFPRRRAEIQLAVLNLLDTDYRLNPLNLQAELPRQRTFTASLRINF